MYFNRHERQTHPDLPTSSSEEMTTENEQSEEETSEEDYKRNYHTARLTFGLFIMLFTDAVKEGDPRRLLHTIKIALLFLFTYGRVKYAYVVLLFLAKFYAILSPAMAFELIHNRFFNALGKIGGNIPLDLRMEHLNKLLKTALKQLGANVSESAAQRIARALTALEHLIANVDNDCLLASKSGYHSAKHLRETVLQITNDLTEEKVFDWQPGRKYQCFKKFKVDLLSKLDHREFFKWGRRLFKVWEPMYYTAQED